MFIKYLSESKRAFIRSSCIKTGELLLSGGSTFLDWYQMSYWRGDGKKGGLGIGPDQPGSHGESVAHDISVVAVSVLLAFVFLFCAMTLIRCAFGLS